MAAEGLTAAAFYKPSLAVIYTTALEMLARGDPTDPVTVVAELERTDRLAAAGGRPAIFSLRDAVPAVANHRAYARRVVEQARRRAIVTEAEELARAARNGGFTEAESLVQLERIREALTATGTAVTLTTTTARELCALPDDQAADELVGPLLVRGQRLVIGAGTGEGKTTFATAMARAVATGGTFLDWPATPGRVPFVDAEQGTRTVKRRLAEAGLDQAENVDIVRVPDGLALDRDPAHVHALEALLQAGTYALVILDPLYKLSATASFDIRR
jgi:replicative DNA helicase